MFELRCFATRNALSLVLPNLGDPNLKLCDLIRVCLVLPKFSEPSLKLCDLIWVTVRV